MRAPGTLQSSRNRFQLHYTRTAFPSGIVQILSVLIIISDILVYQFIFFFWEEKLKSEKNNDGN